VAAEPTDGRPVTWSTAEDVAALVADLEQVADRSSASEEVQALAAGSPWRTAVLALGRDLLVPEVVASARGQQVLEVWPGGGGFTRLLLEAGAVVTAWCRSELEEHLVRSRCADLAGLTTAVVGRDLDDVARPTPVDLLVHLPVELAGQVGVPRSALWSLADDVLRPDGQVVLGFANAVGLDALCGAVDERFGQPFVSLSTPLSRQTGRAVRPWVADELTAHGFTDQRWRSCFPSLGRPSAVVHDRAFEVPDAVDLLPKMVRDLVVPDGDNALMFDPRLTFGHLVGARAARSLAPGFVVVAGRSAGAAEDDGLLVRLGSRDRLPRWCGVTEVVEEPGAARHVRRTRRFPSSGPPEDGWLRQELVADEPYFVAPTVQSRLLDAAADGDLELLGALLGRWYSWLSDQAGPPATEDGPHPFLRADGSGVLPAECFDAMFDNFLVDEAVDGPASLTYIDREWRPEGGASLRAVTVRSLWWFAVRVVTRGGWSPWPDASTPRQMVVRLGGLVGLDVVDDDVERLLDADAALHVKVHGGTVEVARGLLADLDGRSSTGDDRPGSGLARRLLEARSELAAVRTEYETSLGVVADLRGIEDALRAEVVQLREHIEHLGAERSALQAALDDARRHEAAWRKVGRSVRDRLQADDGTADS